MIKVSILYPYRENGRFDSKYYSTRHMPLAARLFGDALRGWSVDIGVNAGPPGTPPYVAAGHFLFDRWTRSTPRSSRTPRHLSTTFPTTPTAEMAGS